MYLYDDRTRCEVRERRILVRNINSYLELNSGGDDCSHISRKWCAIACL